MKLIYEKTFRRVLLSAFIVLFSMVSFSATYYVSNAGNDFNSGLTSSLPWKTLNKVNAMTFMAGDQILFQKGSTFYGTLSIKNSGSSSSPIVYGAYGTGNNPIITGFTTISGWVSEGGGIYSKVITSEAQTNMVSIDEISVGMGRYPNDTYLKYESCNTKVSITDDQLGSSTVWTGAEAVIRKNDWSMDRCLITSHSGNTLTYSSLGSSWNGTAGNGYFIQNDLRTLDKFGEWYHNASTGKFYMYFGTVGTMTNTVKVGTINNIVENSSAKYVNIENISIQGCINNGINISSSTSSNLTIKNCNISFTGANGIRSSAPYMTVDNNIIHSCNLNGIVTTSGNVGISNNTISSIGIIKGSGKSYSQGIMAYVVNNIDIQYNKIENVGYNGIFINGDYITVKNNFINNVCLNLNDGGGIYTDDTNPISMIIEGNIVLNAVGNMEGGETTYKIAEGIYLDEFANGVSVKNNTVAYCGYSGIKLHKAYNNIIQNNTAYDNYVGIYLTSLSKTASPNNNITSNIFVSTHANSHCLYVKDGSDTSPKYGTSNNNYYIKLPNNPSYPFYTYFNTGGSTLRTLAQWQAYTGQDGNSHESPQKIASVSDLRLEYNATKTAKTISLSVPMIDVKGTKHSGSVTLQPFTSIVLIKDAAPTAAVVPGAPTSVVATAGDASATVTFAAPTNNGGSAITGYTVTSLPTGGTDMNAGSTSLTHTISGLTIGTPYTFTVKAINSVGSSVSSAPSNSVVPKSAVTAASTFTFTGPSSGNVNSASSSFTVTPNNVYTGTITLTPSGTGSTGLSSKVLAFSNSSTAQTFTLTPTVAGSIIISATNNGSLANPASLNYTVHAAAPGVPTSVVATAGDANATISFVAPTYNGGSTITGYTVTSLPAGGTDMNAGSTSLTHTISGLTNGTAYTFTVKATNTAGTSYASAASNSVVPGQAKDMVSPVITAFTVPSYFGSLIVPIFAFTASDNIGVTGYLITESSSAPTPGDYGWSTWMPTVYKFSSPGSKTLNAWVKDAAGNVSASRTDQVRVSKVNSRLKNGNNLKNGQTEDMLSEQMDEQIGQIDVFPNPTMGRITVRFSTPPAEGSRIDILDLSGRTIASRIITGMAEEFDLDQQAPGVYLVKSILGSEQRTQKLIITR